LGYASFKDVQGAVDRTAADTAHAETLEFDKKHNPDDVQKQLNTELVFGSLFEVPRSTTDERLGNGPLIYRQRCALISVVVFDPPGFTK
jgi:hypothetical protein